jgi:Ca-activated chloride channel homolog
MVFRLPTALVIAAVAAGVTTVAAQQAPVFSSKTQLVTVAVSVLKSGVPVANLTSDDFEVRSDNELKPIVQFTREPGPITAALLLDASGSMDVNAAMVPAETAARELIDDLTAGQDRAGIFSFDRTLSIRHDFGPVAPTHRVALSGTRAFGSTSLYDAVLSTSRATASDGAPRRAVIVFTDGLDNSSEHKAVDVRALVAAIDVPVFVIAIVPDAALRKHVIVPGHALEELANGTGGQLFTVSPGPSLVTARATIISSLRQHYLLAFEPDVRPGWHRLSVRTRQNHPVRTRAGYSVSPRS